MRTRTLFVVAVLVSVVSLASAQLSGRPSWAKDPSGWAASSWNEGIALDAVKGYGDADKDGKPDYFPREYATREEAHEFAVRYAKWLYEENHGYTDAQIAAVVGAICAEMERATGTKLDPVAVLQAAQAALQGSAAPAAPSTPQPAPGAPPPGASAPGQSVPSAGVPPSGGQPTPTPPAAEIPGTATPAEEPTTPPELTKAGTGMGTLGLGVPPTWSPLATCGVAVAIAGLALLVLWYQRRPRIPRPV